MTLLARHARLKAIHGLSPRPPPTEKRKSLALVFGWALAIVSSDDGRVSTRSGSALTHLWYRAPRHIGYDYQRTDRVGTP